MLITGLFFAANILYCISYMVRDIFWLRLLAVAAAVSTLPYYLTAASEPLWQAVFWASMYLLINGVNLALLLRERRPVQLNPDQERLHRLVFSAYSSRELLRLLNVATWHEAAPSDVLIRQGEESESLLLLAVGQVHIEVDGEFVVEQGDGLFLGELSWLTGQLTSAKVIVAAPSLLVRWHRRDLNQLFVGDTP